MSKSQKASKKVTNGTGKSASNRLPSIVNVKSSKNSTKLNTFDGRQSKLRELKRKSMKTPAESEMIDDLESDIQFEVENGIFELRKSHKNNLASSSEINNNIMDEIIRRRRRNKYQWDKLQPLEDLFRISTSSISRYANDTSNTGLKPIGRPTIVPDKVRDLFIANSSMQAACGDSTTNLNFRDRIKMAAQAVKASTIEVRID